MLWYSLEAPHQGTLLMSTHNMFFCEEIRKNTIYLPDTPFYLVLYIAFRKDMSGLLYIFPLTSTYLQSQHDEKQIRMTAALQKLEEDSWPMLIHGDDLWLVIASCSNKMSIIFTKII